MCAVSMISDRFGQAPIPPDYSWPVTVPASLPWTPDTVKMLEDILKRLDRLDTALGLPDCKDPKKQAWLKEVKAKVRKQKKAKP